MCYIIDYNVQSSQSGTIKTIQQMSTVRTNTPIFKIIINYCFYKRALHAGVIVLNVHILLNKGTTFIY